ncbi:phage tail baseplate protein [Desulfobacter vibrioformis]|uniref:GTA baseplate fiber-binding domain-containing protein n=1 Tax=Desulfobacter vibrioformis TaxID=34031 RepID=UPI00054F7EB4|nr:phage tail protein [Desulfobacter vibrioformis]
MSSKGGGGGGSAPVYYLSWAIGICMGPIETLWAVYQDDNLVWEGELNCPESGGKETVAIEDLGTMDFYFGTEDHEPVADFDNLCYRGLCFAHFKKCRLGNSNTPPVMSFVFSKNPSCSFDPMDAYKNIGEVDYNPVHAIWNALRNYSGFPPEWINEASFLAAAETIYTESRGIQTIISDRQTVLSYVEQVATHINALLSYRSDGQLHLNLLRNDYDSESIPIVDENVLLEPPGISRKSWIDTKNEIRVSYSQRYYTPKSVQILYIVWIDESEDAYWPDISTTWTDDLAAARAQKEEVENAGMSFGAVTCHVLHDEYSIARGIYPESADFPYDLSEYIEVAPGTLIVYFLLDAIYEVIDPSCEELYVVSTVDNSGSMTTETIEPLYSNLKAELLARFINIEIVEHEEARTDERWLSWMTMDVDEALEALMNGYNYRKAVASPISIDIANKDIQGGMTASQSLSLPLFTKNRNAVWAGDEALRQLSSTSATVEFPANRNVFRLEPGDLFKLSYAGYGIENMICRVTRIEEEDLTNEIINITAIEEAAGSIVPHNEYTEPISHNVAVESGTFVSTLPNSKIVEVPYLSADTIAIKPICARYTGNERGYFLYMSIDDGESYSQVLTVTKFNAYGKLTVEYTGDTYTIDDEIGFYIEFSNNDFLGINSIGRADLFEATNLAMLGDELISFQTIDIISETLCHISGVFRGRFDTVKATHSVDTEFFFLGDDTTGLAHSSLVFGADRIFKFVPYSISKMGDLSRATEQSIAIAGRAKKPYIPWNFAANGVDSNALYTTDIVLTWDARIRDQDWVSYDTVVLPTHEGSFEIEVYVSDNLVRTTTAIDAVTWTYTEAMNLADNTTLADEVEFRLVNYRESGGIRYSSDQTAVSVEKE